MVATTSPTVVERSLASLAPEMRRVHEALYVHGLSQRDAAAALGLGRRAIRGIEGRMRAGLRRELDQAGQPLPAAARGGLR